MGEPALARPLFTEEEYLRLEEGSPIRHEYYRGEILAMAGGSETHANIVNRISFALTARLLDSTCEVVTQDIRVKTEEGDHYVYPDVIVYCENREFDKKDRYALRTPIVLVEVLSPSTAEYDRTAKLESYQGIPSLSDYLIVWQDMVRVEHYTRSQEEWLFHRYVSRREVIHLKKFGIDIPVEEIYRRLDLPEGALNFQNSD